jgi:hypothetical protein
MYDKYQSLFRIKCSSVQLKTKTESTTHKRNTSVRDTTSIYVKDYKGKVITFSLNINHKFTRPCYISIYDTSDTKIHSTIVYIVSVICIKISTNTPIKHVVQHRDGVLLVAKFSMAYNNTGIHTVLRSLMEINSELAFLLLAKITLKAL